MRLSADTIKAFIRFGLGGVVSINVALGTAALLHQVAGMPERPAGGCGFAAALVVNFFTLRFFVFPSRDQSMAKQAVGYLATTGVVRLLEFSVFFVVNKYLGIPYLIAMTTVLGTSFLVKFVVYRALFGNRPDGTTDAVPPEV